jgi:hypothetical protein
MPSIENTTDHQFDISVGDQTISIPRSNGEQGPARVNGSVEVSDETLKAIQAHRTAAAWFDSGELIVGKARVVKPAHEDDKKHEHKK